jgi:hypothetical protein
MLRELQAAIREAVLGGPDDRAAAAVSEDGLPAAARLAIYRHHVLATLTDVLQATYPVVCRLVDVRFFGYAADRYIRQHPPAGPCLFEYGDGFGDFLATFPPCQHLPYLPDVARLEWAMNVARHADDVRSLDHHALQRLDRGATPRLTFTFTPSLTSLESPWPIDGIWRANQPDAAEVPVDLTAGDIRLEVWRIGDDVVFRVLSPATWAFRQELIRGRRLVEAATRAISLEPSFALDEALGTLLEDGVLTGFTLR